MSAVFSEREAASDRLADLRKAFQNIWGYPDFRAPQGEIAHAILNGQDIVVVMPTGVIFSRCSETLPPSTIKEL